MDDRDILVYDKMYDMVVGRIYASGRAYPYHKDTFLAGLGEPPRVVDVGKLLNLSNESFFQALFVRVNGKLPDEVKTRKWKEYAEVIPESFQKKALKEIVYSRSAAINRVRFINNPYFKQQRGIRYYFWSLMYGLTDKPSLRVFCRKLPGPVQKLINKVFL